MDRLSVLPSFRLSVFPSESFPGIGSLVFSETQHGVRGLCVIVPEKSDRAGFFKHFFCPINRGNGPKLGFFAFIGKYIH